MAVKKRCPFCLKKLREDGTCSNPDCPRYVSAGETKTENKDTEET